MMNIRLYRAFVALLIDADNVAPIYLEQLLKISEYHGRLDTCRIYGDLNNPALSPWKEKIETINSASFAIEHVQVERVGKNATDHRLLLDAGEILGKDSMQGDTVDIFIIVSGDGDFASAYKGIQEKGCYIIGIGNKKQTSSILPKLGDKFYYLEALDQELDELEKRHAITGKEAHEFEDVLFHAYWRLTPDDDFGWVSTPQLGMKLRELFPDFESKFGKYELPEWLKNFEDLYELDHDGQKIRRKRDTTSQAG